MYVRKLYAILHFVFFARMQLRVLTEHPRTIVVVVVVVVVDLYSASRSASNALIVPLHCNKMSFQRRSEAVGTPSRVPESVWKRFPFHRTRNGESPSTKRVAFLFTPRKKVSGHS